MSSLALEDVAELRVDILNGLSIQMSFFDLGVGLGHDRASVVL